MTYKNQAVNNTYLPNHSLKSVIRSPLTSTSSFVFGVNSSLSFPFNTLDPGAYGDHKPAFILRLFVAK